MDWSWVGLVAVYVSLIVVNVYAVILYRKACYEMKRTKMIKSVYFFLLAFLFENIYFGVVAVGRSLGANQLIGVLEFPLSWAVPKLVIMASLLYFLHASLSPSDQESAGQLPKCPECPISKRRRNS